MKTTVVLGVALLLSLCSCRMNDGYESPDEGITSAIKQLQAAKAPSGTCIAKTLYDNNVKLPYYLMICVD